MPAEIKLIVERSKQIKIPGYIVLKVFSLHSPASLTTVYSLLVASATTLVQSPASLLRRNHLSPAPPTPSPARRCSLFLQLRVKQNLGFERISHTPFLKSHPSLKVGNTLHSLLSLTLICRDMGAGDVGFSSSNLWLAPNPSKRWGELFFLIYTPFWLTLCLGIVVPYKLYENFTEWEYLFLGLVSALPAFIIPMIFVGKADSSLCWKDRYWVKANLWIILFSYVGNYFWTHYFFTVLGASYTFPSWKMNNVPHTTFLLTHVCFLFYHVTSNMTLRRIQHSISHLPEKTQWLFKSAWILALSYFVAYLETLAISNFPYYEFVDRASMYTVGSLFYAIYFFVSFPMFLRIDEKASDAWDLPRVAIDALGAAMLVTIILDLWRIFLGPIVPIPDSKQCLQPGLPWFPSSSTA